VFRKLPRYISKTSLYFWFLFLFSYFVYASTPQTEDDDAINLLQDQTLLLPVSSITSSAPAPFESRVFKSTLNYTLDGEEIDRITWPRKHEHAVLTMGQFILGEKSYPNNIAVGTISYHLEDGVAYDYNIPMFFLSGFQQKPALKTFKKAIKEKLEASYHPYHPVYLSSALDTLQNFSTNLQGLFHLSNQSRCSDREGELKKYTTKFPFPLYYAHSEQAIYFYLLKRQEIWTPLFSSYDKKTPLLYVTLTILTYYDPCIRCGDTGYTLSECVETNGLKKMLLDFFKETLKIKNADNLLENTQLFIQISGIKEYKELTAPTTPLRQGRKSRSSYGVPTLEMIPEVCCFATEDLETDDED
jgi:hypothetical protein